MQLNWLKVGVKNDGFYELGAFDLAHAHFNGLEGVYVIWQARGKVVKVGSGIIRERFEKHAADPEIEAFRTNVKLHVSWAPIPDERLREGVERFLGDTLKPELAERFPDVAPVEVNLPW